MGDEGDDSNEGTGSADGNDGYEADDAEVRFIFFFYSLLNSLQQISAVMHRCRCECLEEKILVWIRPQKLKLILYDGNFL